MGDDYVDEKIEQYERKLKQAEKAGKHHKAKKYAEKLERLRAEAAEQDTDSDTDSDDDDIVQLSVTHLERLARAAGEHDSVRRLPGTTEGSLRDLELRAAILGYGPDAGDDSPLPLVQPRAVAMRTRSL